MCDPQRNKIIGARASQHTNFRHRKEDDRYANCALKCINFLHKHAKNMGERTNRTVSLVIININNIAHEHKYWGKDLITQLTP